MGKFFDEIKRRDVVRAAAAYAVVAWIVVEVASTVLPPLGAPDWVMTMIIVLAGLGFPITLVVSWFYDWTPKGAMTAAAADAGGYVKPAAFGRQIDFVIIALMAVAIGWLIYGRTEPDATAVAEKSIAVLPFANMSSDAEQQYFADGISEELLNALAKLSDLKVVGRISSFSFRGEDRDISEIGRQLRVASVLDGSVRRSGTKLRITARLVSVEDGYNIWSHSFDRELVEVFVIQEEIARAIVDALKIHLAGEVLARPMVNAAANVDAYNLYLLGRHNFEMRTEAALERARELFEGAIKADPRYAPAYDGLVDSLLLLSDGAFGSIPFEEVTEMALPLIIKALEIDPGLAETHATLGFMRRMERDFLAAEAALKRAIELSPNMARAHNWLYITYDGAAKHRAAFRVLERALEIDPLSPIVNTNMAAELWSRNRPEEALIAAGRVIRMAPEIPLGYRRSGRVHWSRGELAEAVGWYRQADAVAPGETNTRRAIGNLLLSLGDYRGAEQLLDKWRHNVYLAEGRVEEAVGAVRQGLAARPDDPYTIVAAARTEAWAGNFDRARQLLEPLAEGSERGKGHLFEHFNVPFWDPAIAATDLALARAGTGDESGADELLAQAGAYFERLRAEGLDHPGITYQEVRILALGGRAGEALAALRGAIDQGWRFWYTAGDPALQTLRDEDEFKDMIAEINSLVAAEGAKLAKMDRNSGGF